LRALYNKTGEKQVSKYKVGFYVDSRANVCSTYQITLIQQKCKDN